MTFLASVFSADEAEKDITQELVRFMDEDYRSDSMTASRCFALEVAT